MKLTTINRWLRRVGLLLVVQIDDGTGDEPTVLRLIRARRYPLGASQDQERRRPLEKDGDES